jgi:hypothetical protein
MKLVAAAVTLLTAAAVALTRTRGGAMRIRLPALTFVAIAGSFFVAQASSAVAAGAPPCAPKLTTIAGKHAVVSCGPAVVIVHIAGKSYTFRKGLCTQSKASGAELQLSVGTLVEGAKGNADKPYISLLIATHGIASAFEADYGGKQLFGDTLIKASGNIPSKGTFVSTAGLGPHFTASWDCHGVVYQAP